MHHPTTNIHTLSLHDALPISSAGAALSIPGIPSNARFPDAMPTFLISGYEQLGSPPNTASSFKTRSEEHTSELQSRFDLVCRLLLEKKKTIIVRELYIISRST